MKKLLIIALIALVAMIGSANAIGSNIVDNTNGQQLAVVEPIMPGVTYTYGLSLDGWNIANTNLTYVLEYNSSMLYVNMLKTGAQTDGSDPFIEYDAVEITLDPSVPLDDTIYTVRITTLDDDQQELSVAELATATQRFNAIPEFPTIALPVAAIIGLAFFMQRRKEE